MSEPQPGRVALITGANRGIGKEVARQLAQRGLTVLVGARDSKRGEVAAVELSGDGEARAVTIDVTSLRSVKAAATWIETTFGRLDVLVNNAGVLLELDFPKPSQVSLDRVRETFETNTFGPITVMQVMLPLLHRSPAGRIVNVTSRQASLSMAGDPDGPGLQLLAYNSSKAGLNAATLQFARELRDSRIKVNLADPMHCATDINGHSGDRPASEGARIVVELALIGDDGPSGAFLSGDGAVPW